MSNALAVASVTQTLFQILTGCLDRAHVPGATVTTLRPDDSTANLPNPGVNIFLYQVAPNAALRNADLPTRTADGTLLRRPQAALDLNYLLTFYGDDTRLEQQRLLGAVVTQMHAFPGLTRAAIQNAEASVPWLATADLDKQSELVRFTPVNFTLEELSKLWSFLLKTDYVLSVAYQASVVLLQSDDVEPPPPLPVLGWNVYATPFSQPLISLIVADGGGMIVPTATLLISGQNLVLMQPGGGSPANALAPAPTQLVIDGLPQTPTSLTSTQMRVALPAGLPAGMHGVQVTQSLMLGTPPAPHPGMLQSGLASFVLHPVIRPAGGGAFEITGAPGGTSPAQDTLTVTVDPQIQVGQRLLLELLPANAPSSSHLIDGGAATAVSNQAVFTFVSPAPGAYLVRVRVDGAESPLQLGVGGVPIGPVFQF
jgi:hypothetical protein